MPCFLTGHRKLNRNPPQWNVNFPVADAIDGSGWLRGYDHQSAAWLVALPSFLYIREWNPFRRDMKFPFLGMRHHLLKGFEQNVAWWNPGSAQNC